LATVGGLAWGVSSSGEATSLEPSPAALEAATRARLETEARVRKQMDLEANERSQAERLKRIREKRE
jgi:hypothetical protein